MKNRDGEFHRSYVESSQEFKRLDFLNKFLTVILDDVYCDIINDLHDQLDIFSEWVLNNVDDIDFQHPVDLWVRYIKTYDSPRFPNKKLKGKVLERFNYCCTNCGSTEDLHIDHIFPYALGGKTAYNNLTVLCSSCNLKKSIKA